MIYLVKNCGYYSTIEKAIIVAKKNYKHIYQIVIDNNSDLCNDKWYTYDEESNNYEILYLRFNKFLDFYYYTYEDSGNFYDENDKILLEENKNKQNEIDKANFEKRKNNIYQKPILLGLCDYPKQFLEKNPTFNGVVKFQKIKREENPNYILQNFIECSSIYDDTYYYAKYIGNYELSYRKTIFNYDGKTVDNNGKILPKIDELWLFETNMYPFEDWVILPNIIYEIKNGIIFDNSYEKINMKNKYQQKMQ
jgi:hypothetical protein